MACRRVHAVHGKGVAAEGFGPRDAALWSDIFADPRTARKRRTAGYADPFDPDDEPG